MTAETKNPQPPQRTQDPHQGQSGEARRYQVSRNRGAARHRIRYLESGGAIDTDDGCPLCTPEPEGAK